VEGIIMAWLEGWQNRRKITISAAPGAGTNYVIPFVFYENLAGGNLIPPYLYSFPPGKNQSGDIRFTLDDGTTLCPFWVGHVGGTPPNRVAFIWVKIPVNLDDQPATIYCYGNNPNAENASSPDGMFELFDDFDSSPIDTTKWEQSYQPINNSNIRLNANTSTDTTNYDDNLYSVQSWTPYSDIEVACLMSGRTSTARLQLGLSTLSGAESYFFKYDDGGPSWWGFFVDGARVCSSGGYCPTAPKVLSLRALGTTALVCEDNTIKYECSANPRNTNQRIFFRSWYNSYTDIDWVFVRKIVDPEPTIDCALSVETVGQPPPAPEQVTLAKPFGQPYIWCDPAYAVPSLCGPGVISGTVLVAGSPAKRRVTLFDRRAMRPLAITWSNPVTGEYRFEGYSPNADYIIICDDYAKTYNAAVADWVQAEVS
jgi:hypothetical protein